MCTYKLNNAKNGIELYFSTVPALAIRESLKNAGWRWSRFGGCWYNKQSEENLTFAQSLADGKEPEETEPKTNYKELIKEFSKRRGTRWNDAEYYLKNTAAAVCLENGDILGIDKPSIKTRFCFQDEGPDAELYDTLHKNSDKMKAYFIRENLEGLNSYIESLDTKSGFYFGFCRFSDRTAQMQPMRYNNLTKCGFIEEGLKKHELAPDWTPATETERKEVLKALETVKADFEKRLNTWWKKYGPDKLHTWTYWANA